jgi:hypothetical protein
VKSATYSLGLETGRKLKTYIFKIRVLREIGSLQGVEILNLKQKHEKSFVARVFKFTWDLNKSIWKSFYSKNMVCV